MNKIKLGKDIYTPSKVICIGKNYPDHIKEMGGGDSPKEPAIFLKPNSAIEYCPKEVFIPKERGLLHYEVELCFIAGKNCKNIGSEDAPSYIAGYAVGIDFTLRDRQSAAKKAGGPWELAKGFDSSAVFGEFVDWAKVKEPCASKILLNLNGNTKQDANTGDMIFKPASIMSFVSGFMTIEAGDIFMCGTPSGVGAVSDGDFILAHIDGLPGLSFKIFRS